MLLHEIQRALMCEYLSDLRTSTANFDRRAQMLILEIPDDRYTIKEWNMAIEYVTGQKSILQTVKEAKEKISLTR